MKPGAGLLLTCICVFYFGVLTSFGQTKEIQVYELFDVSLEELLNVGIVSATKKKQSVSDAPATAYVFTRETIETRGYGNLLDLLEDVPEIEFQKNSAPETRHQITVRGIAGNEKFLILMNGIRITPATGDGYVIGTNLSIANAQRVEVILGPASALYGVDAFSGIINIVTATQEGASFNTAELTTSYGQFNTTDNSFVVATKIDKAIVSLTGHMHHSAEPDYQNLYPADFAWYNEKTSKEGMIVESPYYNFVMPLSDYYSGAGETFYGDSLSRDFAMPSQSYFVNAEVVLPSFSFGYTRHVERHSAAYGVDPMYTTYDREAFIENIQDVFFGKHTFTSLNKKWGLQTTFTQTAYELNPRSHFASAASQWQRGFVYANGQTSKIEEQFNYEFSSSLSLIAGASYERLSALPRTGFSTSPYVKSKSAVEQELYYVGLARFLIDENGEYDEESAIKQKLYNLNYVNFGSYFQLQGGVKKFLQYTVGMRYDYNTRFGGSFNPRVGLVFSPTQKLRVKALYGESFLAPSPKKAYEQSGTFSGYLPFWGYSANYFRIVNPDLKPEKLKSFELTASYLVTPNFSVSVNGYTTWVSNMIDFYGRGNEGEELEQEFHIVHLEKSVNRGQGEINGVSGKLNYLLKAGKFNFNLYGAVSYTRGSMKEYDWEREETVVNPLFYTAALNAKSGIDMNTQRFSVSTRVNYRSPSKATTRNGDDLIEGIRGDFNENPAFAVMDCFISYRMLKTRTLRLFANIENVTNLRYYNVFVGNEEGFARTPQDPRRVSLGIKYSVK